MCRASWCALVKVRQGLCDTTTPKAQNELAHDWGILHLTAILTTNIHHTLK